MKVYNDMQHDVDLANAITVAKAAHAAYIDVRAGCERLYEEIMTLRNEKKKLPIDGTATREQFDRWGVLTVRMVALEQQWLTLSAKKDLASQAFARAYSAAHGLFSQYLPKGAF